MPILTLPKKKVRLPTVVLVPVSLFAQSAAEHAGIAMRCDGAICGNLADDSRVGLLRMSNAECHGAKCTHGNGQHEYRREANFAFLLAKESASAVSGFDAWQQSVGGHSLLAFACRVS
ncbi:hypothetical protein [Dyella acidisoli]|uniref:hypothetical protein n=1 Tax=Dyella acidisoli TaxID=1867834 RepID=UPI0024E153E8|nr:hypothetical protein [Dyella acidisoli]